jgi:hypothetical protein
MMKKVIYFGLMVMVSVMVFGFGISAAEEQATSDNMIASVPQERLATEQTSEEAEGIFVATIDCGSWEPWVCLGFVKDVCCQSSPYAAPDFCKDALSPSNCGKCVTCSD